MAVTGALTRHYKTGLLACRGDRPRALRVVRFCDVSRRITVEKEIGRLNYTQGPGNTLNSDVTSEGLARARRPVLVFGAIGIPQ
jgi:hypothetical protein